MSLLLLAQRVCACQLILLLSWQREPLNLCAAVVMEALGTAGGGGSVDVEGLWEAGLLVLPSHLDPKTPVREKRQIGET